MRENIVTFKHSIQLCVNIALILFVLFSVYFNANNLSTPAVIHQLCIAVLVMICFNVGTSIKRNFNAILLIIFVFQSICLMLVKIFNLEDFPPDGIFYRFIGRTSYYEGLDIIFLHTLDYADWGYCFIVGIFYQIFGCSFGPKILNIFNIIIHLFTCKIIYNIIADFFSKDTAQKVTLLWGLNLGAVYWNSAFLKESFFCFVISLAAYCLYKFCSGGERKSILYFLCFMTCLVLTAFFRMVVPLFLLVSFGSYFIFKRLPSSFLALFVISILLSTYFAMDLVANLFPEAAGGFSQREQNYATGILSLLNVVNPFICPYPAISLTNNQVANIQVSVFAAYNIICAYFTIAGIWSCLGKNLYNLYPIIIILMLNSIMLIAYGFSMNYRYIYIVSPLAYLFIPFGISYIHKRFLFIPYVLVVIFLTFLYNNR